MYEEEEEQEIQKIHIPEYKILYKDLENYKKIVGEVSLGNERLNSTEKVEKKVGEKINLSEKIIQCNIIS